MIKFGGTEEVSEALRLSKDLLEISEDGKSVKRKLELPPFTDRSLQTIFIVFSIFHFYRKDLILLQI